MAAAGAKRQLIWGSGSAPAWRVAIALEEKLLPYESKLIEFSKGEHKSPDMLALNPRGQVPILVDGEVVVNESLAAIMWLDEAYDSGNALMPALKTPARATAWQRLGEALVLGPKVTDPFRTFMMAQREGKPVDQAALDTQLGALRKELQLWEGYLGKTQYLAGAAFSAADVCAAPTLLSAQRYGADFEGLPKLKAYLELVAARPSVKNTWPPHWKDTPRLDAFKGL